MKVCTKCKKEKSVDEFNKDRKNKDGLRYWCKECIKKCQKQYYEENKEKIKKYCEENKERIKQYREGNKEKIKEYNKQYNEKNKEKKKEYNKQYYEENIEKISKQQKQYCEENKEKKKEYAEQYREEKAKYDTFAEQISFCEEIRRDPDDYTLLQVRCTESGCRRWFNPTNQEAQSRIRSINSIKEGVGSCRFYCSEECKQICSLYNRSKYPKGFKPDYLRPEQGDWAKLVKERDNYECQRCGSKENLVVHHFEGLNVNPIMSADLEMGITLCKKCDKRAHSDIGCRYIDLTRRNLCRKERI